MKRYIPCVQGGELPSRTTLKAAIIDVEDSIRAQGGKDNAPVGGWGGHVDEVCPDGEHKIRCTVSKIDDPKMEPYIFQTWTESGIRFLAVPNGSSSVSIVDQNGHNYGSWYSVDSFRKRNVSERPPIGRAYLQVQFPR